MPRHFGKTAYRGRTKGKRGASKEGGRGGQSRLWEWDIANNKVTWSDYIYELHELEPGTFDGTVEAFSALIDPLDQERVSETLNKALAGQREYDIEFPPCPARRPNEMADDQREGHLRR